MIAATILADENFTLQVVEELRRVGHDVRTTRNVHLDNLRTPDADIFARAIREERAVLTFNRIHFHRLHRAFPNHFGIITCTYDRNAAALARRVHERIRELPSLHGQLIRIYLPPK